MGGRHPQRHLLIHDASPCETASIWADGDSLFMPNLGEQEGEALQQPSGHIWWNISTQ